MTEETKNLILENIGALTSLLELYSSQTGEIISTDIDETLDDIVARRGQTVELIGQRIACIDELCADCTQSEKDQVNKLIRTGHLTLGASAQIKEIHKAAIKMRSEYLAIGEKEKKAALRVDARLKELRGELEAIAEDKKKVDAYSANVRIDTKKGGSFDSSH